MRHVLILLENEAYPYDVRVRHEAEALVEAGYRVSCAGPTQPGYEETETTVDGVRVLRYRAPPGGRGAVGYLREYGVALLRLRRLVGRIRRERLVDVVLAANPPDFLGLLALPRRGAAIVFDHHDLSPELFVRKFGHRGLFYGILRAVEGLAYRTADVVIASNESYAEVARERGGVSPDRLFVVRTAPKPDRVYPVEPDDRLRRGFEHLVVWTGSMTQPERVQPLIAAAEELVRGYGRTDIGFALVGPGDARPALEREAESRGLGNQLWFPGQVGDEGLRSWLATADVCVSVDMSNEMNDRSTVTKVIDYMAAGRPVVQFPLAEMERVCGDATLYARNGDARDLADKIMELLDDPARREALGNAGRERMLDGRMWPDQVPVLLRAVEAALAARQRGVTP